MVVYFPSWIPSFSTSISITKSAVPSLLPNFNLPLKSLSYSENIYWVFGLVMKNNIEKAEVIINNLKKKNIGSRPFFYPLTSMPGYEEYAREGKEYKNHNSYSLSRRGLTLPSHYKINKKNIETISSNLIQFFKNNF